MKVHIPGQKREWGWLGAYQKESWLENQLSYSGLTEDLSLILVWLPYNLSAKLELFRGGCY